MKRAVLVALAALWLPLSAPASAAPSAAQAAPLMRTISAFNDALGAGDAARISASCTAGATVVDEFAPFVWRGAGACGRWFAAFGAMAQHASITKPHATLAKPTAMNVAGARAYVVVPTRFAFLVKGKPAWEEGDWTFVLVRSGAGWTIDSHSWATTAMSPDAAG